MRDHSFDQKVLQEFRKLFFPLIIDQKITGYNVYVDQPRESPFSVHYLHSDLGASLDGTPQPHCIELLQKLSKFGPVNIEKRIMCTVTDRMAVYKIGEWEDNPEGLTFFDNQGREIPHNSIDRYFGVMIVEGRQYDLHLIMNNQKEFKHVLKVLNQHVYAKIVKGSRLTSKKNPKAITGAWEIPRLILSATMGGFLPVIDVLVPIGQYIGSTLVPTSQELMRYLKLQATFSQEKERFVNKIFVNSYLSR